MFGLYCDFNEAKYLMDKRKINSELSVEISLYSCSSLQVHCTLTNTCKYMYELKSLYTAALLCKFTALSWVRLVQTKKKDGHSKVKANTNTVTCDNIDRYPQFTMTNTCNNYDKYL